MKNNKLNKKQIGIYVHIPFCVSKCAYCSFFSCNMSEEFIEKYIQNLLVEIKTSSANFKQYEIAFIYFGGGTPSFVDANLIEKVMQCIKENYNVCKNVEASIECNPCSVSLKKLQIYKKSGFNRISFGVQSLNDECLKLIGRKHNKNQALNAIKNAHNAGFDKVSADILIGIPNQTVDMLKSDILELLSHGITHISCYMLMLEEGTVLFDKVRQNKLKVADESECVNMYKHSYSLLKKHGFNRYEISNFAKSGFECKHNLNYWKLGEYLGFGVSACSFVNNVRVNGFNCFEDYFNYCSFIKDKNKTIYDVLCNIKTEQEFLSVEKLLKNGNCEELFNVKDCNINFYEMEYISNKTKCEELIMLGLRLTKGVCLKDLKDLGYDLLKEKAKEIDYYLKNGAICIENDYLFINDDYFGASNKIILDLI